MTNTKLALFVAAVRNAVPREVRSWICDRSTWPLFAGFGLMLAVPLGLSLRPAKRAPPEAQPTVSAVVSGKAAEHVAERGIATEARRPADLAPVAPDGLRPPAPASVAPRTTAEVYEGVFVEQDAIEAELAELTARWVPQLSTDQAARIRLLRRVHGTGQFLQELTTARMVAAWPEESQRTLQQLAQRWAASEAAASDPERKRSP